MPEHYPHRELVVATAHDLLMAPPDALEPQKLLAPRLPEGAFDFGRIIRAAEYRQTGRELRIDIGGGATTEIPFYEVSYLGLQDPGAMRRLVGSFAADQLLVVSRIGGRYAHRTGLPVDGRFGHPADMIRDPVTHKIVAAQRIGVPQPTPYLGADDLSPIHTNKPHADTYRLVNLLQEDMNLELPDGTLVRLPRQKHPADVIYDYDQIAETASGIAIAHSRPAEVVHLPPRENPEDIQLVHTEVLFEALRSGAVSPEEASHMLVTAGLPRNLANQQMNAFTGVAAFSAETLYEIYNDIQI